jgi:hypothetical protein
LCFRPISIRQELICSIHFQSLVRRVYRKKNIGKGKVVPVLHYAPRHEDLCYLIKYHAMKM